MWNRHRKRLLALGTVVAGTIAFAAPTEPSQQAPASPAGGRADSVTVISDRSFDALQEGGWTARRDRHFSIRADPTAPVSPPNVGVAAFPAGFKSGSGPIRTDLALRDRRFTELRFTVWVQFSDGWIGNDAGVNKVFYVWHHGRPSVAIAAFGQGRSSLELQVRLQNTPAGARNLRPNRGSGRVRRGEWQRWDFELVANTPGKADGVVRWWVDGRLAGYYWNVIFGGADDGPYWEQLSWNPTYGGKGRPVPIDQAIAIDHITVAGR